VKLEHHTPDGPIFRLAAREHDALLELLRPYPLVPATFSPTRGDDGSDALREAGELLRDALSERQQENRRALDAFLAESFTTTDSKTWHWHLTHEQCSWLLQIINDLSVGHWHAAGRPGLDTAPLSLNRENLAHLAAIETCQGLQMIFLQILSHKPSSGAGAQ
jgi:hypothetical protein